MNPQIDQQLTQALDQRWDAIQFRILERFEQVCLADLKGATSADDLIHRVSSKSGFTPDYVETQVQELVGVGASQQSSQQQYMPQHSSSQQSSHQVPWDQQRAQGTPLSTFGTRASQKIAQS